MSSWAGTDDLNDALVKVSARNPPSASGVKAVVKVCSNYIKEYKHIVFFVEKFIRECNDNERVPVLYAMDALLRHFTKTSGQEGKKLCDRFSINLANTLAMFATVSSADKKCVKKVTAKWKQKDFFDEGVLDSAVAAANLGGNGGGRNNGASRAAPPAPQQTSDDIMDLLSSVGGGRGPSHQGGYPPQPGGGGSQYHPPTAGYPPRPGMGYQGGGGHASALPPPPRQPYGSVGNHGYPAQQQQYAPRPQMQRPNNPPEGVRPNVGDICKAKVTKVTNSGVFVLCQGDNAGHWGLVHKSKINNEFVSDPQLLGWLQRGMEVWVQLEKIIPKGNRDDLSFTMNRVDQTTGQPLAAPSQPPPYKRQAFGGDRGYPKTQTGANTMPLGRTRNFAPPPGQSAAPYSAAPYNQQQAPSSASTTSGQFRPAPSASYAPFRAAAPPAAAPFTSAAPAAAAPFRAAAPPMAAPFKSAAPVSAAPFRATAPARSGPFTAAAPVAGPFSAAAPVAGPFATKRKREEE